MIDKTSNVCFSEETAGTNATTLKKSVLGLSSGKDDFSVY
jgi:hypothetical protein